MLDMPLSEFIAMLAQHGGGKMEMEVEPKEGNGPMKSKAKMPSMKENAPKKKKKGLAELMDNENECCSEDDQQHVNSSYS
jgi:hypothetical protein